MKRTNLGIWFLVLTATAALIALTVPYETQLPTTAAVTTSLNAHAHSSMSSMLGEFDPLEDCDPWVDVSMDASYYEWHAGHTECNGTIGECDPCPQECYASYEKHWEIDSGKRSANVGTVTSGPGQTWSGAVEVNDITRSCVYPTQDPEDGCCFNETPSGPTYDDFTVTFDKDTCELTLDVEGLFTASVILDGCTNKSFQLDSACNDPNPSWDISCDENGFSFSYTCLTACDSVPKPELTITGSVHVNLLDFDTCDVDDDMDCDCEDFAEVINDDDGPFAGLVGPGVGCGDEDRDIMLLCHYIACVKDEAGWDCTDLEWIIECIEDLLNCGLGGNLVELIAECLGGCNPDCCVEFMETGLYYRQCGEDFKCDQNCDGEIDCDDLTIFVMDSLACNGFVITREQMYELVKIYLSNCLIPAELCEELHDCVEQLLLDIFGPSEPKPAKYELIGMYDAADCCDCRMTENGTPYDHGGDCEAFLCDRVQERVSPGLVSTYTLRELRTWPERTNLAYYAEVTLPHTWIEGMTETYDGPATVTWYNAGNSVIGTSDFEIGVDGYGGAQIGSYGLVISDWDEGDELARSAVHHHLSGLVETTEIWHDLANDGSYTTTYEYDSLGRNATVIDPLGTYTQTTYDILNRTTKVEVGTSDANLVTVAEYFYDSGGTTTSGVGNGNLTLMRAHVDDSNDRDTIYQYDWRDRSIKTTNELPPNQFVVYDNLGRVVEQAIFETTGSTWTNLTDIDDASTRADRGMYKKTAYSQRGMVYAQSIAIDPTVATGSMTFLENHRWFDQVGRTVGSWSPNSPASKTSFDGLGRPTTTYVTDRGGDAAPGATGNHADVYDASNFVAKVNGDVVFEEMTYRYIDGSTPGDHAGMLDLVTSYRRAHDATDSDTGALSSLASAKSIKTFAASYFDAADRVIRSVNYGTNQSGFVHGGSAPTVTQSSPPAVDPDDATKLITATVYNVRGLVDTTEDPAGQVTKYFYDDLNRSIAVAENYDDATVTWNGTDDCWEVGNIDDAELDTDRVTSFVYNGNNQVEIQIAHQPDSMDADDPQKTVYTYGVTKGAGITDSRINHNGFLKEAKYPDSSGASDVMTYAYTRLGETRWMQDQNGSTHTYTRDVLGRVTQDEGVKGGGTDIDDTLDTIAITYDTLGRASTIKTLKKSDGSAANGIKFEYTKLWQISKVWQDVDGDNFTTSPNVQYAYDTQAVGSGNYSRQDVFTYPLGQGYEVKYVGTSDDAISRATGLAPDTGFGPTYEEVGYTYIGLGMVATVDYAVPDVQLDYQVEHNGERNAGEYNGFDRFGRVIHHPWVDGAFDEHVSNTAVPNIPPIVEIEHAYDNSSNRLTARDVRPGAAQTNRDSLYTYDGLDRLAKAERGVVTYNGGSGEWEINSYSTGSQAWDLDMLGNWSGFGTDTTGDGAYTSANEQTNRYHNDVNELTGIDLDDDDSSDITLTYDAAGNLRERPINAGGAKERYTHDLWNRLVKVETYVSSTWYSIGEYEYFGTHWRSVKRADTNSDQTLDEKRELYYSAGWQLLEERVDGDYVSNPGVDRHLQNLWGLRYIDDVIWHREDANGDEDFLDGGDARWWHLTDTQFSTVAILDDGANLQERIKYDAYGKALHHRWRDVDGDRDYDSADRTIIINIAFGPTNQIGQASYRAEADLDRDGDVDTADLAIANTNYESALAPGVLSDSIVKNTIGWDGYVFNPETTQNGGGLYTVRFRSYSTELGRWLERDPAEYVDGMNLGELNSSNPLRRIDPFGLDNTIFGTIELFRHHPNVLFLGGCETQGVILVTREQHLAIHRYLIGRGYGFSAAGQEAWRALSNAERRLLIMDSLRAGGVNDTLIRENIDDIMRGAHPQTKTLRSSCPRNPEIYRCMRGARGGFVATRMLLAIGGTALIGLDIYLFYRDTEELKALVEANKAAAYEQLSHNGRMHGLTTKGYNLGGKTLAELSFTCCGEPFFDDECSESYKVQYGNLFRILSTSMETSPDSAIKTFESEAKRIFDEFLSCMRDSCSNKIKEDGCCPDDCE